MPDRSLDKIRHAEGLLLEALALLDEREFLVEAAFVQTALDRIRETIKVASLADGKNGSGPAQHN